ncbi:MAG: Gfo/Idh/MocA family oxidoreductase [Magnetococcales bacterium]|nr:Gfo/Idh/MocA family oxidoreductase [Magnetococcales bacterium]
MKNLQVAIIGTSGIVPYHIKRLHKITGVTCKWIHSRNLARSEQFAKDNGVLQGTDSLTAILNDDTVDIVMIFNEPTRHVDIATQGLAAGKHLLIEKPVDVDISKAEGLVLAAKNSDRIVGVISQYRFDPLLQQMKKTLEKEAKDLPKTAALTIMKSRNQKYYEWGTGWRISHSPAFMNQGIHWLDVLNWFFGEPMKVHSTATITRPFLQCADMGAALIDYPGNVSVVVHGGTFSSVNLEDQFTIIHPNGSLDYQTLKGPKPPKNFRERLGRKLLKEPVWGVPDCDIQQLAMDDYIAAVREKRAPISSLANGLSALKLAHALSEVN